MTGGLLAVSSIALALFPLGRMIGRHSANGSFGLQTLFAPASILVFIPVVLTTIFMASHPTRAEVVAQVVL